MSVQLMSYHLPQHVRNVIGYAFDGASSILLPSHWGGRGWSECTIDMWINNNSDDGKVESFFSSGGVDFVHLQTGNTGNVAAYTNKGLLMFPIIPPAKNKWRHVVLVLKSGESKLIIDGSQYGETNTTAFDYVTASDNLRIGAGFPSGSERFFNGSVADIKVWFDKVVTAEEIHKELHTFVAEEAKPPVPEPVVVATPTEPLNPAPPIDELITPVPTDALKYGDIISLKSHHNKYLVAESTGALNANRANASIWEQFKIINANDINSTDEVKYGDTIALFSHHKKYVVSENNGLANANRGAMGPWEKFIILNPANLEARDVVNYDSEKVAFKSHFNKYLVAESNGLANANRAAPGAWETWTVEPKVVVVEEKENEVGSIKFGSVISLKSHFNKYLVAEGNGGLNANRSNLGPWEKFTIINASNTSDDSEIKFGDLIALKSVHNKYVVAEASGGANANRAAMGPWEQFKILNPKDLNAKDVINSTKEQVCFRSHFSKYLVSEANGAANANRAAPGPWEKWTVLQA